MYSYTENGPFRVYMYFKAKIRNTMNTSVLLHKHGVQGGLNHYENTPMQYTAIFTAVNITISVIFFRLFSYFCSKHILWVHVRTASMRRF